MSDPSLNPPSTDPAVAKRKRRPRYRGTHPRQYDEKYKELHPEQYPQTVQKVMQAGKTPAGMHRPVMLQEVLDVLNPQPGQTGVDCTLGYGAHSAELWKRCQPDGKLFAFDVDPTQLNRTEARLRQQLNPQESLVVTLGNFAGLAKVLASRQIEGVDFLLADLGVSSMQLDDPARGFSYKTEGPLDLRMNPNKGQSAAAFLRSVPEKDLSRILQENADEPRAAVIARGIDTQRGRHPIETTTDLARVVRQALSVLPARLGDEELKSTCQRVFQALRIHVNDEFSALEALLRQLPQTLKPGGRAAILSFHSGEDRRVKHSLHQGWRSGLYSRISEQVMRPGADECRANPRATCAKLRWAIRSPRESATMPASGNATAESPDHTYLSFRASVIHGTGAFAKTHIPAGAQLIEYLGERISKAESLRRCMRENEYVFTLDEESDLDGDVPWNPARFINHSCEPNCEAVNENSHIWIVSTCAIAPGEEVTFDYGFDLEKYRDYPCRCGSPKCVGYIVAAEYRDQLRNRDTGA